MSQEATFKSIVCEIFGIQEGDIILSLDGAPAASVDVLHRLLTDELVGRPVPVTLLRGTDLLHLQITPEEAS